jgi:hypothetical protein
MKSKTRLVIMGVVFLCLSLAGVAQAIVVKKCYIDGNDWAQQTGSRALRYNFHRLTIAAEGTLWYRYNGLRGAIDEFAIYDRILTDATIAAHASCPPANYIATVTADAPILWLRFEDANSANGSTAADSSGNGQDGTYIGDGPGGQIGDVNLVPGFLGKAAEFYGTSDGNGTCIDINDPDGALEQQDLTVEFWLKSTDLYGSPSLYYTKFFQHNGTNQDANGYGAMIVAGPTVGLIGGGSTEFDPVDPDMNDGQWHHVVFTFDSTPDPNWDPNISVYPYEVAQDNPALYIRCESLPLVDESGYGNWVQAGSGVTIQKVPGSMGNCALLNTGWIAAANQQTEPSSDPCYGPEYAFGDGNDITVEFWLYYPPGTTIDSSAGLWNQNASENPNGWSPGCTRSGVKCRMRCNENRTSGVTSPGYAYTNEGAWASDANNWHHYVMIYDTSDDPDTLHVEWWTDTVRYKNNTYGPETFDNYLGPVMDHIMFGCYGSRFAPSGLYRQYIDEIAVYDYALSEVRIDAHYKAWKPRNCEEVWDRGIFSDLSPIESHIEGQIDRDRDCNIDFFDFAEFAQDWALCNDPQGGAGCTPNW